ncbi:MAG: TetR/AcrR family transcriptional regulator [Ilumatobacteraceae bacterium]
MNPPHDARRSLTKGQRTRQRLLQAGIDRFGADGYRSTSVSQLSRDAGLTPAAAYAYFADKEAFWVAAVEADLDDLDAEIRDEALRSEHPVYTLMVGLFAGLDRHPLTRRVLAEGSDGDLRLVLAHPLFAGTTTALEEGLAARRAAGLLGLDADPEVLARGIETILFSLLLSSVRAGLSDAAIRVSSVATLLRTALGGPPTPAEMEGR